MTLFAAPHEVKASGPERPKSSKSVSEKIFPLSSSGGEGWGEEAF